MASNVQPTFSFIGGINTESSPFTYPENSSIDEQNFELDSSGLRQRRLGVDYETNYVLQNLGFDYTNGLSGYKTQLYRWDNVGNDPDVSYLVVRIGSELRVFDGYEESQSPNEILTNYSTSPLVIGLSDRVGFSTVDGDLIITTSSNSKVYIMYFDPDSLRIKSPDPVANVYIQELGAPVVRDFWGLEDGLAIDERSSSLTNLHKYNLLNQGWTEEKIENFAGAIYPRWTANSYYYNVTKIVPTVPNGYAYQATNSGTAGSTEPTWPTTIDNVVVDGDITWKCIEETSAGLYPSNADIMPLGEKTDGTWDRDLIKDYLLGSTEAPKGKFLLDLFNTGTSRSTESGLTLASAEYIQNPGISCSTAYAGRLFISGIKGTLINSDGESPIIGGMILYSQVVNNRSDLTKFYQAADPTADEINELVDTDGGYIIIPEASNIHRLETVGQSMIVIAENGVWEIRGGETGFIATNYMVNKISNIGSTSPFAIVNAESSIFYLSKSGIQVVEPDSTQTLYQARNITEDTVQKLYLSIPSASREKVQGIYDPDQRKVRFLYQTNSAEEKYIYNRELVLDLRIGAFYKYGFGEKNSSTPNIAGFYTTPNFLATESESLVTDNTGATVTSNGIDAVTVSQTERQNAASSVKYLTLKNPGSSKWQITFSSKSDTSFVDWKTNGDSIDAAGYLVTGYNIANDSMRYKQVPYITFHFNRTETGFDSLLDPLNPSSCLVTPYWDFADKATSGKIGSQFQAYRLNRNYIPTGTGDTFDYGQKVITTKNKLRGRGRSLSLRIDTESGKDCQLYGWSLMMTGGPSV